MSVGSEKHIPVLENNTILYKRKSRAKLTNLPSFSSHHFSACRSVQNNILRSPGYPRNYPNNVDCVNQVFIPLNKGLLVSFNYFSLESGSRCT